MKHAARKILHPAAALLLSLGLFDSGASGLAFADDAAAPSAEGAAQKAAPAPSKHQLMKECMRKERAAISGRPNYELSADCRDITRTEKENADAERKAEDQGG